MIRRHPDGTPPGEIAEALLNTVATVFAHQVASVALAMPCDPEAREAAVLRLCDDVAAHTGRLAARMIAERQGEAA